MVRHTIAWPRLNSPSMPRSETKISAGIWQGTDQRGERVRDRAEAGGLHQHRRAQAAHPGAGDDADRLLLARARERGEVVVGMQRLDQWREHPVGHVGDELDLIGFERLQHDLVPRRRGRWDHGERLLNA